MIVQVRTAGQANTGPGACTAGNANLGSCGPSPHPPKEIDMDITRALGHWVATTRSDWSASALERARHAVQDTVACMVAGAGDSGAHAVRRMVADCGTGTSTVVGNHGRGAAPPMAALANGTSAHALDYDDNFLPGLTHASAALVPALLALAENHDLSGERLLDAYIVGLDVHAVLGRGMGRGHYDVGWHGTATVGGIGTAAACARLLGLDSDAATRAISLGVSMACGVKAQFGSPGKPLQAGLAAQHAVQSATLAAAGLGAHPRAIEGERGFIALFAGATDSDWAAVLAALDGPPVIETHGLAPKRHPCCGSAHRALDGVLDLRTAHGFGAGDVAQVDTHVGYGNARNLCYDTPTQEMEARFSMQYCVAVALLDGHLTLADFTRAAVQRPEVRALMPRVLMHATSEGAEGNNPDARLPHQVRITLRDATVLETSLLWPRGTIAHPFTAEERAHKFRDCCEGFLDREQLAATAHALDGLEGLASVRELTKWLRFEAGNDDGERFSARYANAAE